MAVPVIAKQVTQTIATSTSTSVTAPTRSSGDLLLVTQLIGHTGKTPTTPTGWTVLAVETGLSTLYMRLLGRIASNTSTDNFSSSWSGSTERMTTMYRITGHTVSSLAEIVIGEASTNSEETVFRAWGIVTTKKENLGMIIYDTYTVSELQTWSDGTWESFDESEGFFPAKIKKLENGVISDAEGEFAEPEEYISWMLAIPGVTATEKTNWFVYTGSEWKEVTWKVL